MNKSYGFFKKLLIFIFIIIIIYIIFYLIIKNREKDYLINNQSQNSLDFEKLLLQKDNQISSLNDQISSLNERIFYLTNDDLLKELNYQSSNDKISILKDLKINENQYLKKYNLLNGFYLGINNLYPGSGYIDFYDDNLIILSSRGILAYTPDIENQNFVHQIKNNIKDFIGLDQFKKHRWFSLKDILIHENRIFISFTEELEDDCWNTSIIFADFNFKNLVFKKLFSADSCILSVNNTENEFNAHQSGGRMIPFNDENIFLSVGDYRNRYLAQEDESINGKIIKININNSNFETISKGHRNPQGLLFDKSKNIIIETEHGPFGGDEINIIDMNLYNQNNIPNYGWPISSAGEHYGGKDYPENKEKYKKYPLNKSHKDFGFIEPIKAFVPSIGISEILKIYSNEYVVSSLTDRSLYFFKLNNKNQIIDMEKVNIYERIRDIKIKNKKLYLFLEDTASIGVINLD